MCVCVCVCVCARARARFYFPRPGYETDEQICPIIAHNCKICQIIDEICQIIAGKCKSRSMSIHEYTGMYTTHTTHTQTHSHTNTHVAYIDA